MPEVETHTAGIHPCQIESWEIGNVVLYDLAGQAEYHSSHLAVMDIVMQRTAAVFFNMVDISKNKEEIVRAIHYWLNFIENATCKAHEKSWVGSHADLLSNAELESKSILVTSLVQERMRRQTYVGFVALDCRNIDSRGAFPKPADYSCPCTINELLLLHVVCLPSNRTEKESVHT